MSFKGTLRRGGWINWAAGTFVAVLALVVAGCGGSSSETTLPMAGVWVANSAAGGGVPRVQHYAGVDFASLGTSPFAPSPLLSSPFVSPQDTLFDAFGNLWVVDGGNGTGGGAAIYKFLFNQVSSLNANPGPTPNFVITSAVFRFPQFAAIDSGGNLWVSDSAANAVFKFSVAQLALPSGIGLIPAAVITSAGFNAPLGIVFDFGGNLWVANNGGTTIVELSVLQLAAATGATALTPITILNSTSGPAGLPTINNPWGILFDPAGNLWFTNEQNTPAPMGCAGSVVQFASGTFNGPGVLTPVANVALTPAAMGATSSLCDPNGIAMNASGGIVVANARGNSLAHYTPSQFGSGSVTPATFIVGAATLLNAPAGLTFGPLALQ